MTSTHALTKVTSLSDDDVLRLDLDPANSAVAETERGIVAGDMLGTTRHILGDPRKKGAVGDGVVDDSTEFAATEVVTDTIYLDYSTTYNLGAIKPVDLVHGPGSIILTGSSASPTVSGFQVLFDVAASSIISIPDVWAELANSETSSPGGIDSYFNVILAPGSNANDTDNNNVWRCTIIGEAAGEYITEWERVEAIGSGAMRFSEFAQRTTAVGTIALSWLGATSQQNLRDRFHDFWLQPDDPGQAGWDFVGLETANPGIGAAIDAFSAYATDTSGVSQNVAIGRDAGLHLVKGGANTYVGYQCGAHTFEGIENTGIGSFALKDGVFSDKNTALGYRAGQDAQEGLGNLFLGHESGEGLVDGNRNFFIGGSSGQGYALSGSNHYDNKFIMEAFANGHYLGGDNNIGNLFLNHGSNELADFEGEGSGFYNVVSVGNTPATPGRFLGTSTSSVSTFNSFAGSALDRDHATFENTNGVVGTITTNGTATAYNTSSDERLKHDLGESANSLSIVIGTLVHRFYFKNDPDKNEQLGFFSQELEKTYPQAISGAADGMTDTGNILNAAGDIIKRNVPQPNSDKVGWEKTGECIKPQQIDYGKLVVPLWAALQEQQNQIEQLKSEIQSLRESG